MLIENNPHLLRMENNLLEKEVSEWRRKYYEAQDEINRLSREITELAGMAPARRRYLREQAEKQLSAAEAEAKKLREQASTEVKSLEEIYNAREKELQEKIQTALEEFRKASEKAVIANEETARAKAVLMGIQGGVKELMIQSVHEAEKRRGWRTAVISFVLGVVSSIVASIILFLAVGVST